MENASDANYAYPLLCFLYVSVDIPHAVTGDISFQTINDYGALTPRIKATMQ